MIEKCEPITHLFDAVHQLWDHRRTQRAFATLIFFIYLAGLLGIEANRQGVLPPWLEHITPMSHFQAIHLAFTLILGMEVMELILTISGSLSKSLGKQFEVMALILLRDAFKELSKLPEPVSLTSGIEPVVHIASAGLGALIIFICLGFYYQLRTHQNYITNPEEQMRYVMSKKLISLVLFLLFVGIAVRDLILFVQTGNDADFFETIYTIALVLISQRFMPDFHAVFRNSGFVIGTLIMRLSLSAPWPWNIASSIFAAVFVLALTWATTYFGPSRLRNRLFLNVFRDMRGWSWLPRAWTTPGKSLSWSNCWPSVRKACAVMIWRISGMSRCWKHGPKPSRAWASNPRRTRRP